MHYAIKQWGNDDRPNFTSPGFAFLAHLSFHILIFFIFKFSGANPRRMSYEYKKSNRNPWGETAVKRFQPFVEMKRRQKRAIAS